MVRVTQKRKRSSFSVRPLKRKRFVRRRRFKKSSNFNSVSSNGSGLGFSKKRTSRRQWKNLLWSSSQAQTHYRSLNSAASSLGTPVTPNLQFVSLQTSRRFGGNAFWLSAGGATNPDGGAMPTFTTNGDFTVRGGLYGIRLSNVPDLVDTDKDSIAVTVYLIWTSKGFLSSVIPGTTVPVGWDPSLIADFQTTVGKILYKKSFLVHDGDVFTIERKMGVQKIDQTEYGNLISEPQWLVVYGATSSTATKFLTCVTYYNMSFVGDTV